ncbi:MAG: MFS transporter, partial [Spirochaetota bacterium]
NLNVFANFASIFRNKSFRIHIYMYVCAYAAMDIMMGWLLFYLTDYIGKPEYFNKLLPTLVVAELLFVPVYSSISNKFGHARSFMIGLSLWVLGMAGMAFAQNYPLWLLIVNCVVIGAGLSAGVVIPYNILPFVTDVDELMTRQKRAGTYSGCMTLIRKLIQGALVLPLLGILLSAIDYKQLETDQKAVLTSATQVLSLSQNIEKAPDLAKAATQSAKLIAASERIRTSADKAENLSPAEKTMFVQSAAQIEISAQAIASASDAAVIAENASKIHGAASALQQSLKVEQDQHTKELMRLLFVFSPIVLLVFGIFFSFRFKINGRTHDVLVKEIDRLRSGGRKEDVDPQTKQICETLSGHAYDALWK